MMTVAEAFIAFFFALVCGIVLIAVLAFFGVIR